MERYDSQNHYAFLEMSNCAQKLIQLHSADLPSAPLVGGDGAFAPAEGDHPHPTLPHQGGGELRTKPPRKGKQSEPHLYVFHLAKTLGSCPGSPLVPVLWVQERGAILWGVL